MAYLKHLPESMNTQLEQIPRTWNILADRLAAKGGMTLFSSLYHKGMELPIWIIKIITQERFYI